MYISNVQMSIKRPSPHSRPLRFLGPSLKRLLYVVPTFQFRITFFYFILKYAAVKWFTISNSHWFWQQVFITYHETEHAKCSINGLSLISFITLIKLLGNYQFCLSTSQSRARLSDGRQVILMCVTKSLSCLWGKPAIWFITAIMSQRWTHQFNFL